MYSLRPRLPKGFDKDLRLLLYSMAFRQVVMGFLQVVRAIYFALIGFSPITIGFLLSIATFVSALHHITFGVFSDRFGRKPFLLLGGLFSTARMIIFALTTDFWPLVLGQSIGALGEGVGAGQPVVSGYITDKAEIRQRSTVFSVMAMTNAIAATVGSLMAGLPANLTNVFQINIVEAHFALFWFGAAASAFSFMLVLHLTEVEPRRFEADNSKQKVLNEKSWPIIHRFSLVRSTSGLGWGLIESLLPLYFFLRFDVGSETLGPIYAATRLLSIFSYFLIPRIIHRFGGLSLIFASRLITACIAVAFSMANWFPLAVMLLIIFRTAIMFTMPIRQSFATSLVGPQEIATVIGISNFARMTVRSIAPTLAGYMFEIISLQLPILSGAGFLAVNAVLYRVFFKSRFKQSRW